MNEDKELNLEDLENILSGAPWKIAEDVALENSNLHRQQQIEKLKRQKEELLSAATVTLFTNGATCIISAVRVRRLC